MKTEDTYCLHHKFLKIINRPLCCVDSEGIKFMGKHYKWCDIDVFHERNTDLGVIFVIAMGVPRAIISFNDGMSMKVYPNELYFNEGLTTFEFMSGISSAYREFVNTLKINVCKDRFVCK